MPRRIKPKEANELIELQKKKRRVGLDGVEKRRLKKLTRRTNKGLQEIVRDIRREDP